MVKWNTYSDSFFAFILRGRDAGTEIFSEHEFFFFKLKESHAPENVSKTICFKRAPYHEQMFMMSISF